MNGRWAARMSLVAATSLGPLRRTPGLKMRIEDDILWLLGNALDDSTRQRLLTLSTARLYDVCEDGQLVPHGRVVPFGLLPQGEWTDPSSVLQIVLEPAALSGRLSNRLDLRLVPTTSERECDVLLTTLDDWHRYAVTAAEVRLKTLRFAVSESREVVIVGSPLPAMPGRRCCSSAGIAVPAGWTWEPRLESAVIASLLKLEPGDLALLHETGEWDLIRGRDFTAATRSAVRATWEETAR